MKNLSIPLIMSLAISFLAESSLAETPARAETAPLFTLPGLDGSTHSLKDLKGSIVYLDFWASWCGPCKLSFPAMNTLQDEYADRGLKVLAISVDENEKDIRKFLRRTNAEFTVLVDSAGDVANTYNLPSMPTSYLIDRDGVIQYRHIGFRPGDIDELRKVIEEVINEDS